MAAPLNAQHGYASTELQAVFERAGELAGQLGDTRVQLLGLVGLFAVRYVQGHIGESHDIACRALALSPRHPDLAGQAHFAVAGSATSLGQHEESLPHFQLAHERCENQPPALVGTRIEVHARGWSAHALWLVGRAEEALHWSDWAIARASEVDHPYSLAVALSYAAITHQLRGDVPRTQECARRVQELCTRYDFAYYGNWGLILSGWCAGGVDGAGQIQAGLARLRDQGALARQPYYLGLLAETPDAGRAGRGGRRGAGCRTQRGGRASGPVVAAGAVPAGCPAPPAWRDRAAAPGRSPGRQQGSRVLADRAASDLAERGAGGTEHERSGNAALPTLLAIPGRPDGLPDGGGKP